MPTITVVVPHRLDREEALRRIRERQNAVEQEYADQVRDAESNWHGDVLEFRFKSLGFSIQGSVTVESSQATVKIQVPLAAMIVKGKIQSQVRGELERTLVS